MINFHQNIPYQQEVINDFIKNSKFYCYWTDRALKPINGKVCMIDISGINEEKTILTASRNDQE